MCIIFSSFMYLIIFQGIKLNGIKLSMLSYIDEVFVLFIGILCIYNVVKSKKINKKMAILCILMIAFWLIGIMSAILKSNTTFYALIMSSLLVLKFWIVIISFSTIEFKFDLRKAFIRILFFVEKIAIIIGFFNFFFPSLYLKYFTFAERYTRFGFESISSCFNHPSTFGWFMMVCSFMHFTMYKYENINKQKYYAIISVIFALLSLRTKIIIGVILSFIIFEFIIERKSIMKYIKSIILVSFIVITIIFTFRNVLENTYSLYFKSEQGTTARSALTETGYKIMNDYFPFGVGFGKFGTWYASENYSEYYYIYKINNIYGLQKSDSRYATDTFWPAIMGETGFFRYGTLYNYADLYCKIIIEI